MKALDIEDSPVKLYGWIQNSYTGNANGSPRNGINFGVYPNHLANRWQGNQYYLIVENPNELNDRPNLGFRYDILFGNDWQFTKDYGLFDRAFTPNHFAGVDFPQLYAELHLPWLTKGGLEIVGGRWYSPAGYEGVQAIKRPLLSVPYTLNFTPFTFFGLLNHAPPDRRGQPPERHGQRLGPLDRSELQVELHRRPDLDGQGHEDELQLDLRRRPRPAPAVRGGRHAVLPDRHHPAAVPGESPEPGLRLEQPPVLVHRPDAPVDQEAHRGAAIGPGHRFQHPRLRPRRLAP